MMRYTGKRNGKNVIPLRNAVCGVDLPKWSIAKHSDIQSFLSGDAVDRLAELEDKIEQGTLIELPCKVGDTIFFVYDFGSVSGECIALDEGKVDGVSHQIDGIWVHARYESGLTYWHKKQDIGKTVFFTREEAEKRLEKLKGGK